jgi:hypothetical protein
MRIAILGAGFSGMYAAYLLEKKGHDVVLYEKEEILGGHCRTLVGKNNTTELGTTVFFSNAIKELLLELQLDYSSRLIYRDFLDENFQRIENISKENANLLVQEFSRLKELLDSYRCLEITKNYGYIHPDLLLPIDVFLTKNNLQTITQVLAPLLSAFGFGDMHHVQAYYAFHAFDQEILRRFIEGDKFLFIKDGTSALINSLSKEISCIRLSQEVVNIEPQNTSVLVETVYSSELFDRVLVTTKLSSGIIKEDTLNNFMQKVSTNPYFTCVYRVNNKRLAATYYNSNLGQKEKIQFFHTRRQNHKTTLVSYTYGNLNKNTVNKVTAELQTTGIDVGHLITAKQWNIFPHIKMNDLTSTFYADVLEAEKKNHILFAGSLVSKPELGGLYHAVQESVDLLLS